MNETFGYLVKHDIYRWRDKKKSSLWVRFYMGLVLLIILAAVVVLGVLGHFLPLSLLFVTYGLPYMTFMLAYNGINQEWKNGTVGWWLTLPYSRGKLVSAKFTTAMINSLLIYATTFVVISLLMLLGLAAGGTLDAGQIGNLLITELLWFGFSCSLIPFMSAFGLMTGTLMVSRLKPVTPLLWVGFGLSGNMLTWFTGFFTDKTYFEQMERLGNEGVFFPYPNWIAVALPVSLLISALFVWISGRVVDKHLTL